MRMLNDKQKRRYFILLALIVIILAGVQLYLQRAFDEATEELVSAHMNIAELRSTSDSKQTLLKRYKDFEAVIMAQMGAATVFPSSAMEMYTAVDAVMKANRVEHTNSSSSSSTAPGGVLQLQITYSGSYYDILKALADLRTGEYAMRVSDFKISAIEGSRVSGVMTVLSSTVGETAR